MEVEDGGPDCDMSEEALEEKCLLQLQVEEGGLRASIPVS